MRYIALSFILLLTFLTGCAMPPRLHTFSDIEKDSTQTINIPKRELTTDTLSVKPRVNRTEITFAVGPRDSARLLVNKEFCYNEASNEIWLQNEQSPNLYTAIPKDSIRVCQKMMKGSQRPYFIRNRGLFWPVVIGGAGAVVALPIAGVVWIASSGTAALITEAAGIGIGAAAGLGPAVYFSNTDGGAIRPDYDYCDAYYSENDLMPWLQENRCTE